MVGVAQSVEHRVVAPVVEGSSPFTHPIILLHAPVAQLDRAPDFESVSRRFESCRAYQIFQILTNYKSPALPHLSRYFAQILPKIHFSYASFWFPLLT